MRRYYVIFSGDKYRAWTERIVRDVPRMGRYWSIRIPTFSGGSNR